MVINNISGASWGTSAMNEAVLYDKRGHIAHITLNRPEAKNVIDERLAVELEDVCQRVNQDDDVYVVTITGAGNNFCGGSELAPGERRYHPSAAIAGIDRPVIAVINGDALAQGLELALACDVRLAADTAHFALPQVAQGLIPMDGGTQRLPRIVGRGKAMELLLAAETISAREAFEIGLVSKVVSSGELMAEVEGLTRTMVSKGPIALRFMKEAVNKGMDLTLEQGLHLEADLYFLLHTTADRTEGIRAFLEKRPPQFKGK